VIRAILLDFYGTVVEEDDAFTERVCREAAALVGTDPVPLGRRWGAEFHAAADRSHGAHFRRQRELVVESLCSASGGSLDVDSARLLCASQIAYWRGPALRPGSAEFLARFPLPICVLSDIDRDDLEAAMAARGIGVDHTVTSEDVGAYKPRPEGFVRALESLGLSAAEVVHVGDSLHSDIAGAAALGIRPVWVRRGRTAPAAGVESIEDLRDLLPLLVG
jgi:2-haloacid dehalogenase/putative hydrolase of the HAD superfamily